MQNRINTLKITLIGPNQSGKSALVKALQEAPLTESEPTQNSIHTKLPIKDINIEITDTPGWDPWLNYTNTLIAQKKDIYVLVLTIQDLNFYSSALERVLTESNEIEVEKILIVSQSDVGAKISNPEAEIESLCKACNIRKFFYCSAKTGAGIAELKNYLYHRALHYIDLLPIQRKFETIIAGTSQITGSLYQATLNELDEKVNELSFLGKFDPLKSISAQQELTNSLQYLTDKAKNKSLTTADVTQFEKKAPRYFKNQNWRIILGAIIGTLMGLALGFAVGLATGAAPVAALLGAIKGAQVGITIAGGLLGTSVGFFSITNKLNKNAAAAEARPEPAPIQKLPAQTTLQV